MRNTFNPTSMLVSCPVAGSGAMGTSAQEIHAYQPSASRRIVTVLGVPWSGRCSRRRIRPIFDRRSIPPSSAAPPCLPSPPSPPSPPCAHLRIGEAVIAIFALQTWGAGSLTGLQAAEEGGERLVQAMQHVLQDLRVDLAVLGP